MEPVLNSAQDACCNLQCDDMVHSVPTHTQPLRAVILSKWGVAIFAGVWLPANQGLQDNGN